MVQGKVAQHDGRVTIVRSAEPPNQNEFSITPESLNTLYENYFTETVQGTT